MNDDQRKAITAYITELKANSFEYSQFLQTLKKRAVRAIRTSLGYNKPDDGDDTYDTLSPDVFWPMMVIAMKKCLGQDNAQAEITDKNAYFHLIPESLNAAQVRVHNKCINFFAMDVSKISKKTWVDLRYYLHNLGSKNKKIKTRKKNLKRVEERIHRIMIVNRISHNGIQGNIFSQGRYLVPRQFEHALVKLFLTH